MAIRYADTPVNLLAAEVAKVFGGNHVTLGHDNEYYEGWAEVEVPAFNDTPAYNINLSLRGYGVAKNKVTVSLSPIRKNNDVNLSGIVFPSAGFDITRDFQAIIAGISKRVVNVAGGMDAIREFERRKQALEDQKKGLQEHLEDVLKSCPNVRAADPTRCSNSQVPLYNSSGIYFNATLWSNGTLSFDRLSSMSMDQAKRILAILNE